MSEKTVLVATWEAGLTSFYGDAVVPELKGKPVRGLTADGSGGALAIVGQHSLCRRLAGGNWRVIGESGIELACCTAVGDDIYVGTDDARLLRLGSRQNAFEVLNSFERVAGRDRWFDGSSVVNGIRLGPPLGIRSLACTSDRLTLLANVHVGGIPRSADRGETWQPTIDIYSDVHEVCAHPRDPQVVVAAASAGLCVSRDAGSTWSIEQDGLHSSYCSAVAFSGDDILVSASAGHFAKQGRLYRRSPSGDVTRVERGFPTWTDGIIDTGCIAVNHSFVAVIDKAGNLYTSTDFGSSWSQRNTAFKAPSSLLICDL